MNASRVICYRRCHVCHQLSDQAGKDEANLAECVHCHKIFIPFLFFDDRKTPVLCDNEPRPKISESYLPIRGFTSYW